MRVDRHHARQVKAFQSGAAEFQRRLTLNGSAFEWLLKRGAAIGVEFDARGLLSDRLPAGEHPTNWARARQTRSSSPKSTMKARLTVTDPIKLCAALFNGIGKANAYGCGLMLIRRA